jgi:hypothetical protein
MERLMGFNTRSGVKFPGDELLARRVSHVRPPQTRTRSEGQSPPYGNANEKSLGMLWPKWASAAWERFRDEAALDDETFQPYGQIVIMDANGSNQRVITGGRWEDSMPLLIPARFRSPLHGLL